jgi:NAD(P)-dependent dehydrogenase (short-subunit alcohol dehydrogenase family)
MGTVLLTGVGREGQVGEVVARVFAERGDRVILVDRNADTGAARAAEMKRLGFDATAYSCDLSAPASVDAMVADLNRDFGGSLDAAVLMAGGFGVSGPVASSSIEELDRQLTINLRTAYLTSRAVVPMLRATQGSIVYFASEAVLPTGKLAGVSAYGIAKSGVLALMRAVSEEERKAGVRANAVAPAAIRTARNLDEMGSGTKYVERESVAAVVSFLCSDAAANITGQVFHLAAGGTAAVPSS